MGKAGEPRYLDREWVLVRKEMKKEAMEGKDFKPKPDS